jgi:uncharacterized Fe-S cluster protein YjdI
MPLEKYTNASLTVTWDSRKCVHSAECMRRLPSVFDLERKPWVDLAAARAEDIMNTVRACPSGALQLSAPDGESAPGRPGPSATVTLAPNGPLLVKGEVQLLDADGKEIQHAASFALCRCGASSRKPFCDGTHRKIGFTAP